MTKWANVVVISLMALAAKVGAGEKEIVAELRDAGVTVRIQAHYMVLEFRRSTATERNFKELCELRSLDSINLYGFPATPAVLRTIGQLGHLRNLNLQQQTTVTDRDLCELRGLLRLEILDLQGTQVTNAGLREVAKLKSLRFLNLWDTKVTDTGVIELQRALPDCEIAYKPHLRSL
jgi:hypothetical protein